MATTNTRKNMTGKNPESKIAPKTDKIKHIGLVKNDGYLEPYEEAIRGRHEHYLWKMSQLTQNGKIALTDFANGYAYYGLHPTPNGWVFREWAPNAERIFLVGDFNEWTETESYQVKRISETGDWELMLPHAALKNGDLYKMHVYWNGGMGERIPAWCQRVVQDKQTGIFSAQVWAPEKHFVWSKKKFKPIVDTLLI